MTEFQNLHTHTTYCDGILSAEDMIKAALEKGCTSLGFSEHSHVPFDIYYSMGLEASEKYVREIRTLAKKYESQIEIFLGLERDFYTENIPEDLDYLIGALHYVKSNGQFVSVDAGVNHQKEMVDTFFGGDYYILAEEYFSSFSNIAKITGADIIGHFDLVAKYNFDGNLFDESHPRYVDAALCAMDEILKDCKLFEVNTGAMYRLNKPNPYPSVFLLKELCKRGGEVILSSDSHDGHSIGHKFEQMQPLLKTCGFTHIKRLTKSGFIDISL
ncbi:MAG: histidinol-phosphatase [Oscillospiraceae bacterium]|nr:histidinol-phosphatase [Oscillospiraceae bacterium]